MKITRTVLATIMLNAWALARYGAAQFDGNVKEYLSIALKISWKEARRNSATSWSKEYGVRHLLPGLDFSGVHKGQILLPGLLIK